MRRPAAASRGTPWAAQNRAEDRLQEATADYLRRLPSSAIATPFVAIHVANEARRGRAEMGQLIRMGFCPGAADWVLSWISGSAWIEFKSRAGRQTENQRAFESECRAKRIPYFVVRDLVRFETILVGLDLVRYPLLTPKTSE